jgi:hypothetical protein
MVRTIAETVSRINFRDAVETLSAVEYRDAVAARVDPLELGAATIIDATETAARGRSVSTLARIGNGAVTVANPDDYAAGIGLILAAVADLNPDYIAQLGREFASDSGIRRRIASFLSHSL